MGAHSTLQITRTQAMVFITRKLDTVNDEELGSIMDALLYDNLYNCTIVADHNENQDEILHCL